MLIVLFCGNIGKVVINISGGIINGENWIINVIATSLIWGTITVVFDVFGWVLIKHPWSLSFKEFYIDYQPWITLIYNNICKSFYCLWSN